MGAYIRQMNPIFIENILKRMLSRLPRELLEELVTKRKIYSFEYSNSTWSIWVDGARILELGVQYKAIFDESSISLLSTGGSGILVDITTENVAITCQGPLALRFPLRDCDMASFRRAIESIPTIKVRSV